MYTEFIIVIITTVFTNSAIAWTETVIFNTCYGTIYYANNDKSYKMSWDGDYRPQTCKVTFHGWDDDNVLDRYKICIRATTWNIQSSDVELRYYGDEVVLQDNLRMTYSKYSSSNPRTTWCSDSEDYVDILLITGAGENQGNIELEITAEKTFDYGTVVGWSVGGAIAGIALISTIVTIIVVRSCRRRRGFTGQVIRSQNIAGPTFVTQSGTQQMMGGYGNNTFGPPPYSYNSYGNGQSGQPAHGQDVTGFQQHK